MNPTPTTYWINVYNNGQGIWWPEKESAERIANKSNDKVLYRLKVTPK